MSRRKVIRPKVDSCQLMSCGSETRWCILAPGGGGECHTCGEWAPVLHMPIVAHHDYCSAHCPACRSLRDAIPLWMRRSDVLAECWTNLARGVAGDRLSARLIGLYSHCVRYVPESADYLVETLALLYAADCPCVLVHAIEDWNALSVLLQLRLVRMVHEEYVELVTIPHDVALRLALRYTVCPDEDLSDTVPIPAVHA